jgi:vitamin B12 transporter
MEARGARNLGDVLRPTVGLTVGTLGSLGSFQPVSIRGSSNEQVLVLVDGVRLNPAQGGGVDFSDLPIESVERVEVIRGGASALWGGDALAGIVNIVTLPEGAAGGSALRAGLGSLGARSASFDHRIGRGALRGSFLRARAVRSDGTFEYESPSIGGTTRANSSLRSSYVDGGVRLLPRGRRTADPTVEPAPAPPAGPGSGPLLHFSYYFAKKGVPGPAEFPTPNASQTDLRWSGGLTQTLPGLGGAGVGGGTLVLRADNQVRRFDDSESFLGAAHDLHENRTYSGTAAVPLPEVGRASGTLAAEGRRDRLRSTLLGRVVREAAALAVHARFEARRAAAREILLLPAVRLDARSDGGPARSRKLGGAVEEILPGTSLRASVGTSFRAPSFDDLFWPTRATFAGNEDLRPERGRDLDAGLSWTSRNRNAGASLTLFRNRIRDLIQWSPGAAGIWRPRNIGRADLKGIEAEARRDGLGAGPVRLGGTLNYAWLDPENESDSPTVRGRDLPGRPRHRANAILEIDAPGRLRLESEVSAVGSRFATEANTKKLPGYTLWNLSLTGSPARWLRLGASVRNVTNAAYVDIRDYPTPGREWSVTMGLRTPEPATGAPRAREVP